MPCRRLAEVERARLERILEALENRRIDNRLNGTTGGAQQSHVDRKDASYAKEITDVEARLRALYEHGTEDS